MITSTWAPSAYVVSFKLETDKTVLIEKAKASIRNYNVHLVVAYQLQVIYIVLFQMF